MAQRVEDFPEMTHGLIELPFFYEDISTVFEIKPNLNNKIKQQKNSWKRKRCFRRWKCLHHRRRNKANTLPTVQKMDDVSKNMNKNLQDDDLDSQTLSDTASNQVIEQLQPSDLFSIQPLSHPQITGEEPRVENSASEDVSLLTNDEGYKDPEQPPLPTEDNKNEHSNGKEDFGDHGKKNTNALQSVKAQEGLKDNDTDHAVTSDPMEQIIIKDLVAKQTGPVQEDQTFLENQPNLATKRKPRPNYFVAIPITNDEV
ncbi:uncharacterized protein [Hyperolius riggenbachi]|uniref:uncharacterized protein n=1 Tax=Hyperolius riggenbachi TaxID=752182 RepID=UPI0035A342B6